MKLFFGQRTCALAPMILAEWLDIPLEAQKVDLRNPSPEFLQANPLGAAPALILDTGRPMTQVDAILQYFCALKPDSGLDAGEDIMDQFELHRWVAFLTGDFHPPFGVWFNPRRFTTDHGEASLAAVKDAAALRIGRVSKILDEQVGNSQHIALDRRTLLDAYAYAMVRWLDFLSGGLGVFPNLARIMAELSDDPGVQRALARESA